MISSMTAFARRELQATFGNMAWEIRSVNHRYLEVNFRLPEMASSLEPLLREQLKNRLQRGKVDITLRFQPAANADNKVAINKSLAQQLIQARAELAELIPQVGSPGTELEFAL